MADAYLLRRRRTLLLFAGLMLGMLLVERRELRTGAHEPGDGRERFEGIGDEFRDTAPAGTSERR